jgi:fructoselysine 6-kinase
MTLELIAVGDNCLDVYLSKDHMAVGGNALNVAVQWHRQGLAARYFGVVGKDAEGEVILAALEQVGLDPADVELRDGSTAVTLLLEQGGDRRFLLEDLGVGLGYLPEPSRKGRMLAANWVHLGTNTPVALVDELVRSGRPFSVDVSTRHDALPLDGVPLVFASGPEQADLQVEPLLQAFRERGAQRTVMTCGSRGAYLDDGVRVRHVAARAVEPIDTCGAGDSFIASFLATWLAGRSDEDALLAATAAAAATCLHEAGFPQPLRHIPEWLLHEYADVIASAEVRE